MGESGLEVVDDGIPSPRGALHRRPARLRRIAGIGVDRMGSLADALPERDFLRLENLDVDIPPDAAAVERTRLAASTDADNSYLPFVGRSTCAGRRRGTSRASPGSTTTASVTA